MLGPKLVGEPRGPRQRAAKDDGGRSSKDELTLLAVCPHGHSILGRDGQRQIRCRLQRASLRRDLDCDLTATADSAWRRSSQST